MKNVRMSASAMIRGLVTVGSLVALVLLLSWPTASRATAGATLELTPNRGLAGAAVTAVGGGHTANGASVELHWGSVTGPRLATTATDAQGRYRVTITIPASASPGTYAIFSCETRYTRCDQVGHEFYVGTKGTFVVDPEVVAIRPTVPMVPVVPDTGGAGGTGRFGSFIGEGEQGIYGRYSSPVDGFDPTPFIPRCAPPEGAHILDFDTDTPAAPPDVSTTPEVSRLDLPVHDAPSGTITPRHALRTPREAAVRHVVTFATPQRYVGLYVGDQSESAQLIELVATGAAGEIVAVDRLPGAHATVDTCMAVRTETPGIRSIEIRVDPSADLYLDRLFFSATGDMSVPTGVVSGELEILYPADRERMNTDRRQLLQGIVRVPIGLSIDEVVLSLPRWDRTRTDHHLLDFIDEGELDGKQQYRFGSEGYYVAEGSSWLSVTAKGPGAIATGAVEVTGIGHPPLRNVDLPGRVDIEPVTLEVTQAIRGEVPLIPPGEVLTERTDAVLVQNKRTVVRGFARLIIPEGEVFEGALRVNAELVGTRDGVSLPDSPLTPIHATVGLLAEGRDEAYHGGKQATYRSWNFVLPDAWTDPGSIDLRLQVNSPSLPGHVEELAGRDGALDVIGLDEVTFRSKNAPGVNIWLVDYYYRCRAPGAPMRPGQGASPTSAESFCTGLGEGDVVHAKPTPAMAAQSVMQSWAMAPFPGLAPPTFDLWSYVYADDGVPASELGPDPLLSPGSPQEGFWLGVALRMDVVVGVDGYKTLNALMTSFIRGKAWGSPSFFRVTPTPTTFIHESSHTMGLRHTGNGHGESGWIQRWSGDHGEIERSRELVSAFDARLMQAVPYAGLHDYMSYRNPRWASLAVWHHVEDAVGSGFARVDNRVDDDAGRFLGEVFSDAPAGEGETMVLRGRIRPSGVALEAGFDLPGGVRTSEGELVFRLLAADGSVVSESATVPIRSNDDDEETLAFIVPVRVSARATELVIVRDGKELDRRPLAPAPPDPGAPRLGGTASLGASGAPEKIMWTGPSKDVRYRLEVSRDSRQWFPLATTDAPEATIDVNRLPFQGRGWKMRVQASSGTNLTISSTIPVEFPTRPLEPMILLPQEGAVVSANTFVPLHAAVSSFSSGGEDELRWSVDGKQVSVGRAGTMVAHQPGEHEITLASPTSGKVARTTITVVADADLDGMSDEWERKWGLDPEDPSDSDRDDDGDAVPAWEEFARGSSPAASDTDGDGYDDRVEADLGTDPTKPSSFPAVGLDGKPLPPSAAPKDATTGAKDAAEGDDEDPQRGWSPLVLAALGVLLVGVLLGLVLWLRRRRSR